MGLNNCHSVVRLNLRRYKQGEGRGDMQTGWQEMTRALIVRLAISTDIVGATCGDTGIAREERRRYVKILLAVYFKQGGSKN